MKKTKKKYQNVLKILENTQLYDLVSEIYEDNERTKNNVCIR